MGSVISCVVHVCPLHACLHRRAPFKHFQPDPGLWVHGRCSSLTNHPCSVWLIWGRGILRNWFLVISAQRFPVRWFPSYPEMHFFSEVGICCGMGYNVLVHTMQIARGSNLRVWVLCLRPRECWSVGPRALSFLYQLVIKGPWNWRWRWSVVMD